VLLDLLKKPERLGGEAVFATRQAVEPIVLRHGGGIGAELHLEAFLVRLTERAADAALEVLQESGFVRS
jgi:hypothetical protein